MALLCENTKMLQKKDEKTRHQAFKEGNYVSLETAAA